MAINMPNTPQASPLERLAMLMGVVKTGKETYDTFKKSALEDREKKAALDPMSGLNLDARQAYEKEIGGPVAKTATLAQLQGQYGPLAEIAAGKRKFAQEKELTRYKADLDNRNALAKAGADAKNNPNKREFDFLPVENQEQIKKLGTSNATKQAIRNQLAATLETLKDPQVPYEQKYMASKNLGKTLNSTEGQDAVGEGEAGRLLSFLNYMPVDRPGWDFGPQIDKFADQVSLKIRDIDQAVASNDAQIQQLYGRSAQPRQVAHPELMTAGKGGGGGDLFPSAQAGPGKTSFTPEDLEAMQWAKDNPTDPRAADIRNRLRMKGLK